MNEYLLLCGTLILTVFGLNSLFDQLGFISPVSTEIKPLYQFVCEEKLRWDETYLRIICCVGKGGYRL